MDLICVFLLMIWLIFFKSQAFPVCRRCHSGDIHYGLESSCIQKELRNIIFSSHFLVVFQFLVLALAAKHRNHVSKKSRSLRDNWYPISHTIIVLCKVSSRQSLIKHSIFVSDSHPIRLDKKSMTRRSTIVGFKGGSSTHSVQCGPDEPSWT